MEPSPIGKNGASGGRILRTEKGKGKEAQNPLCQYCQILRASMEHDKCESSFIRFEPTWYIGTGIRCWNRPQEIWPALLDLPAVNTQA